MSTPPASTVATPATRPDRAGPAASTARPPPACGDDASVLARCVGDVGRFASQHWGRTPLMSTSRDRSDGALLDGFGDVFSLDAVDQLIASGARVPTVRMVADGAPLMQTRYCTPTRLGGRDLDDVVDPIKVAARVAEGATLVLQSLHRTWPSVAAFADQLQDEVSHPVQANAYLTPPSAAGLAEHADPHDVLAIQLHGSKQWWVDGLGDVTATPGDVIYVPRGVRHRAETVTDTSLHVTVGIIRVTYRQVVERILRSGPDILDEPLPIGYRHGGRRDELERGVDIALDGVLDHIGAADLTAVVAAEQARRLTRPSRAGRISSLVHVDDIDADTVVRWVALEPLAKAVDAVDSRLGHWDGLRCHDHWSPPPERITVHLGTRLLTLPTTTLAALRVLSAGHPTRVGELPGLDEPGRAVLAKRLVREAACVIERS